MSNLINKIVINTFIQTFGKLLSVFIGIFSVYLLTHALGVDGYGRFSLIFAYLSFFMTLGDFGMHLSTVKNLSQSNKNTSLVIGTYFWMKVFLALISVILSILLLFLLPYDLLLKKGIVIGSIGMGIGLISGFGNAVFQSKLKIGTLTILDSITKVSTIGFILLFIGLKLGFLYIVSAIIFGNMIGFSLLILFLIKDRTFSLSFDIENAKKLVRLSIPIGITTLFTILYFKIDTIMLSFLRTPPELGLYSVSYKIFENLLLIWGFFMVSSYPIIARKGLLKNKNELNSFVKKNIKVAILSSLLIGLFFYIFAYDVIKLLAGKEFLASSISLKILVISLPFFYINNIFYHTVIVYEKTWNLVRMFFVSLLINILLNLIFIPRYGYIGASITTVITEVFVFLYYLLFFKLRIYEQ